MLIVDAVAQPPTIEVPADQRESGITEFPPAFFAAARPTSALDMLQRVPGFTLDAGTAVRGFGGAAGNVLVNGRRPSTKADGLNELLQRIPATAVARIDLIRGTVPGIDMQGRAVVANVVLTAGARSEAIVIGAIRAYGDGRFAPVGQLDWSRNDGERSLSASASYYDEDGGEHGAGSETIRDAAGSLLDAGRVERTDIDRGVRLRGSRQSPLLGGLARLNVALNYDFTDKSERVLHQLMPDPAAIDIVAEARRVPSGEIGGDFTRRIGARSELTLVALQSLKRRRYRSTSDEAGTSSAFSQTQFTGESILRGSVVRSAAPGLSIRGGVEGAFNFLDGRSQFTEEGVQIPLPNAEVLVEESRGEAFGFATWIVGQSLNLEAGATLETSTISQSGDTESSRSFFFAKPRAALTWTPSNMWQFRLRIEREVGQLDFADFAASASLSDGTVSAGNANLEPERRWAFEGTIEHRFWGEGSLAVTVNHSDLEQVIDQVPVDGFNAPGNIGDGRRDWVRLALTAPLARIGMPGGLLNADVRRLWSRVTDPTTGEPRMISGDVPWTGSIRLTYDLPRIRSTWTLTAALGDRLREYRIDEILTYRFGPQIGFAWEFKPNERVSILFEVNNLARRERVFTRFGYPGPRDEVPLGFVDRQSIRFPTHIFLRLRRTL